jgi:hypothetical protein
MRIEKIAYEQLFPTGVYQNQRYYAEATVDWEKDDIVECYKTLKSCVKNTFIELNPEIPPIQEEQPTDKIDSFIATINYCTNKKFLENFKKRVDEENDPRLTEAYDNKLKSFQ